MHVGENVRGPLCPFNEGASQSPEEPRHSTSHSRDIGWPNYNLTSISNGIKIVTNVDINVFNQRVVIDFVEERNLNITESHQINDF